MPETLLTQYLKRGAPDPLADIGQGGPGLYQSPNPVPGEIAAIGEHFVPEYLRNNNVHAIEPNEVGKTPRSQPMNPLPWLGMDIAGNLATGGAKAAAPFMKSMFFGPLAKTANLGKLKLAKEMAAEGAHGGLKELNRIQTQEQAAAAEKLMPGFLHTRDKNIFNETGWLRRPDGKWREYDPATHAEVPESLLNKANTPEGMPLDRVLMYPKLYDAYPDLADIRVRTLPEGNSQLAGSFNPFTGKMQVKPGPDRASTTLHETTHGIQDMTGEDFAPGANPKSMMLLGKEILKNKGAKFPLSGDEAGQLNAAANSLYRRHSGEDEAYLAEYLWRNKHTPIYPGNSVQGASRQVVPGDWLSNQTSEIQDYVKNTMTHQFQGGPPTLQNYINLLKLDAK